MKNLILFFAISIAMCSCGKEELVVLTIQERLDMGESPWDIYQSSELTYTPNFGGKHYEGGLIISFDKQNGEGLIVSKEDLGFYPWGCQDIIIPELNDLEDNDGKDNTDILVAQNCSTGSAAEACHNYVSDGYDGWFLPSISMLANLERLGQSVKGLYWSSSYGLNDWTEQDSSYAYALFINMDESCIKYQNLFIEGIRCELEVERKLSKRVRAFRRFGK